MIQIQKAARKSVRPSIGLFGPSGSGKTMSSLRLAYGIVGNWEKIVVIDTENGSSELYAGYKNGEVEIGQFNVIRLTPPYTPERYIEAIDTAEKAGMEVIIIDSISHEWDGKGGILEMVEEMSKGAKGSFAVWGKMTPRHNAFIDRIVRSHAYVICCGRAKQDYVIEQQERNGKTVSVPKKIGLKAVTREGFDYELTIAFDVPISHYAETSKDRTGIFSVKPAHILTEKDGETIKNWVETGEPDPDEEKRQEAISKVRELIKELGSSEEVVEGIAGRPISSMTIAQLRRVYADLNATKKKREEERKRQEQEEGRATPEEEAKIPDEDRANIE
jgi:nucleoside-triphosphatase THEP1